jgi:DNA-binding transcriptional ArsR family regulator
MINAVMDHLAPPEPPADLDETLLALADPTRRRVVDLLRAGPRRASEIAEAVGMSRQATSRHLNQLRDRGIVAVDLVDGDGRGRAYRLVPERLAVLGAWLDQVRAGHAEQLTAFKRHAERRGGDAGTGATGGTFP